MNQPSSSATYGRSLTSRPCDFKLITLIPIIVPKEHGILQLDGTIWMSLP